MAGAGGGSRERLTRFAHAATDLILPIACVVCERLIPHSEKGVVCGHCWTLAVELPHPRCERCGHPIDKYSCRWCVNLPAFVRSARSWCWIGAGTGKDIIHALKYDGWTRAACDIADRMCRVSFPPDVVEERHAIVPIPLSRDRMRERGFNQCELIANHVARRWNIQVLANALVRGSSSRSQTRLTPGERLSNVAGAFSVPASARDNIGGRHVILLDDVVTTGATLHAAASALFAAGARTLSCMTFGRAPASGDRLIQQEHTKWQ